MANLTISATEVVQLSGREIKGVAGEVITKGQGLAFDSSDNKYYLADNNSGTAARKTINGVALEAASAAGIPIRIAKSGVVYLGATLTVGTVYVVSATAGAIAPYADLATGNDIIIVGVGGPGQWEMTLVMKDSNVAYP